MGEQKYLTAREARELATTSNAMKNHIYKQIKEEANENHTWTYWNFYQCPEETVKKLIDDLEKDGYKVSVDEEEELYEVLRISW